MKRFGYLAVLMLLLSSSAHAGSYSFTYHGHRVRVERPRHCFSTSCLSVSAPGLHGTQDEDDVDDVAAAPDASKSPTPSSSSSTSTAPAAAPAQAKPATAPPVAVATQATTAPAVPPRAEFKVLSVEKRLPAEKLTAERPAEKPATEKPPVTAQSAPEAAPATATQEASSEPADTPLGDWQTEGNKGLVRIEPCGNALCGYTVDTATNAKGETVLINMKKGASDWTGTIVSRASGSTYYAKMAIKQFNTLRVEACAVGRFFCSGNDWSRIVTKPQALITSRQTTAQPPS